MTPGKPPTTRDIIAEIVHNLDTAHLEALVMQFSHTNKGPSEIVKAFADQLEY